MILFKKMKDGGHESTVTGYWLIEWKRAFSIVLLKFEGKSREAFHTHAFGALSWLLKGMLFEDCKQWVGYSFNLYRPSWLPIFTPRDRMHKVDSNGTSWVLSFRGPWAKTWKEYLPEKQEYITLTSGRTEVM